MTSARPLKNLTRETLAPIWCRREIPMERIAGALGVTRQGLAYKAKSLGLPSRKGNYDGQKLGSDERFRKMWLAGVSVEDMTKYFGYASHRGVIHRRGRLGLPLRTRGDGTNKHAGWVETISLAEFLERELRDAMILERFGLGDPRLFDGKGKDGV